MNLYAGVYDYVVFGLLLVTNIFLWKKKISYKAGCVLGLIVFSFLLPLISMGVEMSVYKSNTIEKPFEDSFATFYTFYRFPVYWAIGILQVIILAVKTKMRTTKKELKD